MGGMLNRIRREPVLVTALVAAILQLLVAFGLNLSTEQNIAVMGVVGAVLAFVARSKVSPVVQAGDPH